ncbi:bifunctional isochorismate lyase/aryl carrier protein [Microbacterium testaceum]|uniref:isochorismatase family protein n=1 Tax=Microbacterium TaxID=33882 RepID=UPI00278852E8|nr:MULTISPECIES: isochorismatase family protein [Microbacterium]MDQ1113585.1 bifunctional isochorismate lyase/aryl carrier protein [Microbacterium testaceum]MDR6099316.1 bifunctional isochorismate lyase/aryl carrier protein [Microbacterium sp. SORGH_AS_0454]
MALPRIRPYTAPTEIPASTLDWRIDPERSVLLVHDMQEHFAGAFVRGAEPFAPAVAAIHNLREVADAAGVPVVYTAQPGGQSPVERGLQLDLWGAGVPSGDGERIVAELEPRAHDHRLTKWRYDAFVRSGLEDLLADLGRDQIIITGVYAHIGCLMTAASAFMGDRQAFLVADAVADFSRDDHEMALSYVARRCGVVTTADQVSRALAGAMAAVPR